MPEEKEYYWVRDKHYPGLPMTIAEKDVSIFGGGVVWWLCGSDMESKDKNIEVIAKVERPK